MIDWLIWSWNVSSSDYLQKTGQARLGEESVEAVDFLPFLDVGVVLGDTLEGEFFHEVDDCWLDHVTFLLVSLRLTETRRDSLRSA